MSSPTQSSKSTWLCGYWVPIHVLGPNNPFIYIICAFVSNILYRIQKPTCCLKINSYIKSKLNLILRQMERNLDGVPVLRSPSFPVLLSEVDKCRCPVRGNTYLYRNALLASIVWSNPLFRAPSITRNPRICITISDITPASQHSGIFYQSVLSLFTDLPPGSKKRFLLPRPPFLLDDHPATEHQVVE